MSKQSTLLKATSILSIIFCSLGAVVILMTLPLIDMVRSRPGVPEATLQLIEDTLSISSIVLSVITSLIGVAAGILGLVRKSWIACLAVMGLYILLQLYSLISAIPTSGFSPTAIISFIIPVLYLWGVYQAKD